MTDISTPKLQREEKLANVLALIHEVNIKYFGGSYFLYIPVHDKWLNKDISIKAIRADLDAIVVGYLEEEQHKISRFIEQEKDRELNSKAEATETCGSPMNDNPPHVAETAKSEPQATPAQTRDISILTINQTCLLLR